MSFCHLVVCNSFVICALVFVISSYCSWIIQGSVVAIERMSKITIFFPAGEGERLEEWLYSHTVLHLVGVEKDFPRFGSSAQPIILDEREAETNLGRVRDLLAEVNALGTAGKSFIDSLLPVKTVVGPGELTDARASLDLEKIHAEVKKCVETLRGCRARLAVLAKEREHLAHFVFISVPLIELRALKRTFCTVAEGGPARLENIAKDSEVVKLVSWEVRRIHGGLVTAVFAGVKRDESKCADILRAHRERILEFPDLLIDFDERIDEVDGETAGIRETIASIQGRLESLLAPETVKRLEILNGYWESEKRRAGKARSMLCSHRVGVARGFAREVDAQKFIDDLERDFPGVSAIAEEPVPGDAVPVSIKLPRWLNPLQLLINMFGLPDYFSIDPTPYLACVFLIFFGICFADVVYGFLLMLLSWMLMRRYRRQGNLREFFHLFYYCGISTVIFGVLTGSYAADIYNYCGEGGAFQRFVQKTTLLDMLAKPVISLMIALGIGIVNQLFGIVVRIIKDSRYKNWRGAIYDGVLWLVYLGGLLVFILASIAGCGGAFRTAGIYATVIGAIGLILTQGRDEKGIAGKAIFGVVSLYGIVGGYGTVSFIGDVLSYSRLLALGLTTYIVGMSFNIIAKLVPSILISLTGIFEMVPFLSKLGPLLAKVIGFPVVSAAIIMAVMVFGHLFNFFLSILSAFVHSARLILLEWFGRFYQGGGEWFQPHGFRSDTVELVEE